ncbi:MAG: hypothetical protein LQ344_001418 [Seirophora lacunosa]|nr:MAG: hypothetical protein LQ344_001418 [Seirophora lacunosa]
MSISDRSANASGRVSGVSLLESRGPAKAQPSPGYPIVRHVLGTRTIIYAHVRQIPIDRAVIGATIRQAQDTVEGIMKTERDRWLPPAWDPYIADWHWGAYIFVESSEKPGRGGRPQHLTFGILNSTFEGLFQIAYVLGYSQELDFEVLDSDWGIVGAGYIMAGSFHDGSVRGQKERSAGWIPTSSKDGSDATTAF